MTKTTYSTPVLSQRKTYNSKDRFVTPNKYVTSNFTVLEMKLLIKKSERKRANPNYVKSTQSKLWNDTKLGENLSQVVLNLINLLLQIKWKN